MSNVSESTITSPELVLLQMIIENDHQQSEADKAARDSARDVQLEAMQDELEALDDQADAIRTGAFIEGGLQIAGGTLTVAGAVTCTEAAPPLQPEASAWTVPTLKVAGQVATGLAEPAGDLFGRAAEADAKHDAQAADQQREQASWVAEDAENHREKAERHAETLIKQVQGVLDTQHQTTVAVIANI